MPTRRAVAGSCGQCGTCKPAQIRAASSRGRTCVLVGDGTSDRFAAAEADLVFAKDRLRDWCGEEGVPFVPFDRLDDILEALRILDMAGTGGNEPLPSW